MSSVLPGVRTVKVQPGHIKGELTRLILRTQLLPIALEHQSDSAQTQVIMATVQTKLVGGADGVSFNDGGAIGGWPTTQNISSTHPIQQIDVFAGWTIDGITITYEKENGDTAKVVHGTPGARSTIKFGKTESLLGIVGRAGYHSYYKRSMVTQITFIIVDTSSSAVRIEGPFGNGDRSNQGEVFKVSQPIAFAGYAKEGSDPLGLSGLSFIKAFFAE
ncbi:hypothetical protein OE88DRAFT_1662825 [Heliocybe sulcata]|uniref:Jacalin-type lectin domain-containing protein n=1 Tax=Heliocybe sulcata TaxID=5364 RepID=A0A5C3MVF3_9AGAM|nr:hypothetical protein OE88DRAFT_1662825 [Heliocybe sulcata]